MKRYIKCSYEEDLQRSSIAQTSNDAQVLAKLADDDSWIVRREIAWRTDHPEFLAKLADDENYFVRSAVAETTNDPKLLAKLATDRDFDVRYAVARKANDPELLNRLATDSNWNVQRTARRRMEELGLKSKKSHIHKPSSASSIKKLFQNNDICIVAMEHVNDSDPEWEYDTAESFSGACLDWIYDNLDVVSDICGKQITDEDVSKISDWIIDECSQGDFDIEE